MATKKKVASKQRLNRKAVSEKNKRTAVSRKIMSLRAHWMNDLIKEDQELYFLKIVSSVKALIKVAGRAHKQKVSEELIYLIVYLDNGKPLDAEHHPFDVSLKRFKQAHLHKKESNKAELYKILSHFFIENPNQEFEYENVHGLCARCHKPLSKEEREDLIKRAEAAQYHNKQFE